MSSRVWWPVAVVFILVLVLLLRVFVATPGAPLDAQATTMKHVADLTTAKIQEKIRAKTEAQTQPNAQANDAQTSLEANLQESKTTAGAVLAGQTERQSGAASKTASKLAVTQTVAPQPNVPAPSTAGEVIIEMQTKQACATAPNAKTLAPPALPKVITGRVGLYVARFSSNSKVFAPDLVITKNTNSVFPLASNYKQAVLFELLRQAQTGKLRLDERFSVTRANQSYGDYPYDNTTALDLAKQMIGLSYNTSTDILHRRVGLGGLQPNADHLGLCNTRLLLPTKTWWVAEAGFGGKDFPKDALVSAAQRFASANKSTRLEIAKRLDNAARATSVNQLVPALEKTYFAGRSRETMAVIDRSLQNASTPLEWAMFVHHLFLGGELQPKFLNRLREIEALGKGSAFLKVPYAYFGGKSGNTARVLTYSGYLETLSGDRIVYVYLNDESQTIPTRDQTPQVFYYINQALKKIMRPEDLIPAAKTLPASKTLPLPAKAPN